MFCSTDKVYGDRPNHLPLVETETRLEVHRHRHPPHRVGYGAKQVRDNIHAYDVVRAFQASNISMLEAIAACEQIAGRELNWTLSDQARIGDHRWWISDLAAFQHDHPDWQLTHGIDDVLNAIYEQNAERWSDVAA